MTYLTHDPVTKATYRVHNGRGVFVKHQRSFKGEFRFVRFRLASGEVLAFLGVVQDTNP